MKTLKQLLDERSLDSELAIHAVIEYIKQFSINPKNTICLEDYVIGRNDFRNELVRNLK